MYIVYIYKYPSAAAAAVYKSINTLFVHNDDDGLRCATARTHKQKGFIFRLSTSWDGDDDDWIQLEQFSVYIYTIRFFVTTHTDARAPQAKYLF